MPGATDVYAIPYPCAGENIDCTVFAAWANAIQAAVTSVRALESDALTRPSARASGTNQSPFVAGTPTNVVYQTEVYDNDAIVDLTVDNTAFTIITPGWYMFASSIETEVSATTTSVSLGLSRNGTVLYRSKHSPNPIGPNPTPGVQVIGLIFCSAADVIRAVYTYTGGASPVLLTATTFCYMVSQA